jgi:Flp pilus assembly pilin Flp
MRPPSTRRPLSRAPSAPARTGTWRATVQTRTATVFTRFGRRRDDRGATAIEWAIFAILAITIAGLVAAAITAAINNRLPGIN